MPTPQAAGLLSGGFIPDAGVVDPLGEEERLCNLIAESIAPRVFRERDLIEH